MFEYLKDRDFLKELSSQQLKTHYVKIILMDFNEKPLEEITGIISSGNLSINGSAAIRRTINLSLQTSLSNENIIKKFGLNKKICVYTGYKNTLKKYKNEDIIWFPCGIFIIASLSVSKGINSQNISISGRDKMVLLDGSVGGKFPATVVLHEKWEYESIKNSPEIIKKIKDVKIFDIIYEIVHHYGEEMPWNILINDIPEYGRLLVKYVGDNSIYISDSGGFSYTQAEGYDSYSKGQDIGYRKTEFTYPGELVFSAGDNVVSVLNKICNTLGNFEFFYDVYGRFIFRKKRMYKEQYISDTSFALNNMTSDFYMPLFLNQERTFVINDLKNITQINYNPKYENIKNDYIVWGKRENAYGNEELIRYHLAIDEKPEINPQFLYENIYISGATLKKKYSENYLLYKFLKGKFSLEENIVKLEKKGNDWFYKDSKYNLETELNLSADSNSTNITIRKVQEQDIREAQEKNITLKKYYQNNNTLDNGVKKTINNNNYYSILISSNQYSDWREELYRMALIHSLDNDRYSYYYPEMIAEWRKIYDPIIWDGNNKGWNPEMINYPSNLVYWIDFIDSPELFQYQIQKVGRRMEVLNSDAKTVFNKEPPDLIFYSADDELKPNSEETKRFLLQPQLNDLFVASSTKASAFDKIKDLLYQHINYNTQISLTGYPCYYLEPNDILYLQDKEKGKVQKYNILSLSLPLTHSQMMTITATEIFEKF